MLVNTLNNTNSHCENVLYLYDSSLAPFEVWRNHTLIVKLFLYSLVCAKL